MTALRKPTKPGSNSEPFIEHFGIAKNCMTCSMWKSTTGWKKHPNRPWLECKQCAEKRK
jgi:hypothetical protein